MSKRKNSPPSKYLKDMPVDNGLGMNNVLLKLIIPGGKKMAKQHLAWDQEHAEVWKTLETLPPKQLVSTISTLMFEIKRLIEGDEPFTTYSARLVINRDKNLAGGRPKGVQKNQENSQAKIKNIEDAIDDLFKHGRGYQMSNEGIRDFLIARGISKYKRSYTKKIVDKIAPVMWQKYKLGQ